VDREARSACVFDGSAALTVQCMRMLTEVEHAANNGSDMHAVLLAELLA
jgi:hypothetical protein